MTDPFAGDSFFQGAPIDLSAWTRRPPPVFGNSPGASKMRYAVTVSDADSVAVESSPHQTVNSPGSTSHLPVGEK